MMNDFLIHENIPVTFYSNVLTFRESNKSFELDGGLLKTMTNYKFNAGHSNLQDQKRICEFAEEMKFDYKNIGRKSPRDSSIVKLLKSLAILACGIFTIFSSSDPNVLCGKLKMLLQKKRAGNNSNIFNEEIVARIDKLLDYKSITHSKHKKVLKKINLLHTKKV